MKFSFEKLNWSVWIHLLFKTRNIQLICQYVQINDEKNNVFILWLINYLFSIFFDDDSFNTRNYVTELV